MRTGTAMNGPPTGEMRWYHAGYYSGRADVSKTSETSQQAVNGSPGRRPVPAAGLRKAFFQQLAPIWFSLEQQSSPRGHHTLAFFVSTDSLLWLQSSSTVERELLSNPSSVGVHPCKEI